MTQRKSVATSATPPTLLTLRSDTLTALAARLGKARSKFLVQSWRYELMKMAVAVFLVLCRVNVALADDVAFRNVKVADAKGKQADASLIFDESNKAMVVRVADRDFVNIPYDKIDKLSYEYSKKHRITQGAIVMVASLGAGAVVMLTKSKSHWLNVDFHQESGPSSLVLRMDKKNYKTILNTATAQTGKQVEFLGDAKSKK
jgi:hypothetical protein